MGRNWDLQTSALASRLVSFCRNHCWPGVLWHLTESTGDKHLPASPLRMVFFFKFPERIFWICEIHNLQGKYKQKIQELTQTLFSNCNTCHSSVSGPKASARPASHISPLGSLLRSPLVASLINAKLCLVAGSRHQPLFSVCG